MKAEQIVGCIRDLVNRPVANRRLSTDKKSWHQLCSCLDVLEDSQLAIDAFGSALSGESKGRLYLAIYGLLQAMYIQQDAVFNLLEAMKLPTARPNDLPEIRYVRELRNDAVGHPTKRDLPRSRPVSWFFISRGTMSRTGFELLSFDANGSTLRKRISIPDLVVKQEDGICSLLSRVKESLEREAKTAKGRAMSTKLVGIIEPMSDHSFSHVSEYIDGSQQDWPSELILSEINYLAGRISDFESELARRGTRADAWPAVKQVLVEIKHGLTHMREHVSKGTTDPPSGATRTIAIMICEQSRQRYHELIGLAKEIDANTE